MKRIWQHPEEPKTGRRYWRSVGELEQRESFLKNLGREFPNGDELTEEERESSRRNFLKLMGASVGMMGLASCRRPIANILPYTKNVEWIVPGKPLMYATTMPRPYGATPLVVTTYEGRPTHLSGNPLNPSTPSGGLDSFAQASILDLYDPERSQKVLSNGKVAEWGAVEGVIGALAKGGGEGLAILVGAEISPTTRRLRAEVLKALPKAKLFQYEAINNDTQAAANKAIFGAGTRPVVKLDQAMAILSLDCDFLCLDSVSPDGQAKFISNRNADKPSEADKMNRLYAIENRYTLTGSMADHRKPLAASLLPVAAAALAVEIGKLGGNAALGAAAAALAATADAALLEWIKPAAADLFANKGKAVVLAGSRTPAAVQALAAAINDALGAFGPVIDLLKGEDNTAGSIADLAAGINSGAVRTLLSFTCADPVFDAPTSLDFAKVVADKKVTVIHHGTRFNATAKIAALHIPATHYLEVWGDALTADGVYSIVQPMIQPLYNGVSENEIYLALLGKKKFVVAKPAADAKPASAPAGPVEDPGYEAVRETFATVAGGLDETKWNFTLRDGFLKGTQAAAGGGFNAGAVASLVSAGKVPVAPTEQALEVVLVPDNSLWDGRYINNGWLQEAPDPVTKLTWDNAALIGSVTYRKLGLKAQKEGLAPKVEITIGDKKLVLPALEAPGHVTNSITIQLGYGQTVTGFIGKGTGFNGYKLLTNPGEFVLTGATIKATGDDYQLAITQEHDTMEGRALYREGTKEDEENFAQVTGIDSHIPQSVSLYGGQFGPKSEENPQGFDFERRHQWGMSIDLSKCLGCTSCLIACQSENNIPIVGKDQVQKGRIMHWIRMDRYFATPEKDDVDIDPKLEDLENAEMVTQPVACQQCESAPCETVCPVNATVHTEEGLNAMAYNRCIGTRYCANNCPYTARRFNWFDYNKRPLDELYWGPLSTPEKTGLKESMKLQKNPNVTVRMRGVIEKCTYCVQRLESAKIQQMQVQRDSKNFRIPTDSVKSACQQACPTGAIEFGDIADKNSAVFKIKGDGTKENPGSLRNYELLKYINTRPRTSYLARIRNVNPAMPGAKGIAAWSKENS
ncbi:MAG: hydrogenase [Verrucomicrobiaceae bacterium]|nr:hydrogenase [Verrucomicrobiaceae bacterium]